MQMLSSGFATSWVVGILYWYLIMLAWPTQPGDPSVGNQKFRFTAREETA